MNLKHASNLSTATGGVLGVFAHRVSMRCPVGVHSGKRSVNAAIGLLPQAIAGN
jgi:hypothetical protein